MSNQYLCNSCGACFAVCNQEAIQFVETVGGYLFPVVDTKSCTNCGLCNQVCPGTQLGKTLIKEVPQDPFKGLVKACYVGRAADNEIFLNSQSGGLATALLRSLFEAGKVEAAIVAVMDSRTPPRGAVRVVTNPDDLTLAQKSKYSPIPLLKALRQLPAGTRSVAIVGVACQMHGLSNLRDVVTTYQKIKFFKIGLVCDRVLTSAAIDYMGRLATKERIDGLVWRDKQKYCYPGNPVVHTTGGQEILLKASQRMEIKDFFTPARCRLCFDKLNVYADVTLGDPHGIKGVDRTLGENVMFVRTDIGLQLVEEARAECTIILRKISSEEAIRGQEIEKKRIMWSEFMTAWIGMGRRQPVFPLTLASCSDVAEQIHWLQHSLQLDRFSSRGAVLRAADKWVFLRKVRRDWRWPFSKFKQLLSRAWRGLIR